MGYEPAPGGYAPAPGGYGSARGTLSGSLYPGSEGVGAYPPAVGSGLGGRSSPDMLSPGRDIEPGRRPGCADYALISNRRSRLRAGLVSCLSARAAVLIGLSADGPLPRRGRGGSATLSAVVTER